MRKVPVGKNYVAWVDDEDYERVVAAGPWRESRRGRGLVYAQANIRKPDGSQTGIYMHTLITGFKETDHRTHALADEGVIDNRRSNLREVTHQQNAANQRKAEGCSSQYKGVSWDSERGKWHARMWVNGKNIHLGRFADEQDAARAYNEAAKRRYGEFALLNEGI